MQKDTLRNHIPLSLPDMKNLMSKRYFAETVLLDGVRQDLTKIPLKFIALWQKEGWQVYGQVICDQDDHCEPWSLRILINHERLLTTLKVFLEQ